MKLSMEELVEFLQVSLSKNFYLEDDFVIEQLQISMTELRRAKLDLPAPGNTLNNTHSHNHSKPKEPFLTMTDARLIYQHKGIF